MKSPECAEVLDNLAAVAESDKLLDHLADCDDCRDARHEAEIAAQALADAGADYVVPDDMAQRVLDALGEAAPTDEPEPATDPDDAEDSAGRAAILSRAAKLDAGDAVARSAQAKNPANSNRRKWALAAAAVVLVGGGAIAYQLGASSSSGSSAPVAETPMGLTGAIAHVDRAASDDQAGVSLRAPGASSFVAWDGEAEIPAGATVRTDERTRVRIALSDGSEVTLNHRTELRLDATARELSLAAGELVADVATIADSTAVFTTPTGRVDVLGTRFALSATDEFSSVRVTRGLVRLSDRSGASVEVRPGEEGTVTAGDAPRVTPVVDLAGSMSWSELAGATDAQSSMSGLGELRAFKPGEQRDRDWKLTLAHHKVTVRIVGNVARTEIEETFQNDSDVTLEGVYKFPMPPDARIDRLALDVEGGFEEGAFVSKERASRIWAGVIENAAPNKRRKPQEIIWVPGPWRDPALLEWQRGGRFELRIFPIPARGARTVKIAYTQTIKPYGHRRRYVYPLAHSADGSNQVARFDMDVRIGGVGDDAQVATYGYEFERSRDRDSTSGAVRLAMAKQQFSPRGNVIIEYALPDRETEVRAWTFRGDVAAAPSQTSAPKSSRRVGIDSQVVAEQQRVAADSRPTVLFALRPKLPRWTEARPRDYAIVVDSSQSMVGERFARASRLVSAMIADMDRRDRVTVLACDVSCQRMADGALAAPSSAVAKQASAWLAGIEIAGASDVLAAVRQAGKTVSTTRARDPWIIYVGDGMASMGHRRTGALAASVAEFARERGVSVSTVGIGADADATALGAIARAGGGQFVPYTPGETIARAALSVLETTYGVSLRDPVVELPSGITDIAPGALATIRAGDEVLVAGRLTGGAIRGDVVLKGSVGGEPYINRFPVELDVSTAMGNAFVPRMWASLMIDKLEHLGRGEDRTKIIALSKAYGVLSRHTSLLVLESEAMFKAFGVDRAQPAVRWTGEEEAETVVATGVTDYGKSGGRSGGGGSAIRSKGSKAPTKKAKRKDSSLSLSEQCVLDPLSCDGRASSGLSSRRRRRPGRWMRRVWFRTGSVSAFKSIPPNVIKVVADNEQALQRTPDSREVHRSLVQALSYSGQLDRAYQVASQWLERDRLDPQALVYMADILGRQGHRERSLRLLSGVVDIDVDNADLHTRLARAYTRIGAIDRACAHHIARAELASHTRDDKKSRRKAKQTVETIARAVRCQRALGRTRGASETLRGLASEDLRQRVELAAARPGAEERARGELVMNATWTGGADVDLTVVTPRGTRLSWMGGRKTVRAANAGDLARERLALTKIKRGNYLIEVSRADATSTAPIAGHIEITLLGDKHRLPFTLTGSRAVVGHIAVRNQSRLEPM